MECDVERPVMCHSDNNDDDDDDDDDEASEVEAAWTPKRDPRCQVVTWEPPGIPGSEARDVLCVQPFYSDHVVCTWRPGHQAPPGVQYSLSYWLTGHSKWSEMREGAVVRESSAGPSGNGSGLLRASFPLSEPVQLCLGLAVLISSPDTRVRPVYRTLPARKLVQAPKPGNLSLAIDSHGEVVVSWEVPDLQSSSRPPSSLMYNVCMTDNVDTVCIERKEPRAFVDNEKVHTIAVQARLCDSWDNKITWDHSSEWQHLVLPARRDEDKEGKDLLVAAALIAPAIIAFVIMCIAVKYGWMVKAHVWPQIPGPSDLLHDFKFAKEQIAQAPTCRVPEEFFSSVEILSECQSSRAARQPLIPSIVTAVPPPPPPPPSAAAVVGVTAGAGVLATATDYCSLAEANAGPSAWRPG
uniref:Interleukin-13 receptor subunit alpha-1-like n=1 Tax=Petromyzon marinus TaxID=7757 RepID=A0AAJ7UGU2_PETMA|nr:interleukin-13 receptor subunit alpha-1-like [Petromyzon marinus]